MPGTAGWVEYRDPRYGYGLALPCYWTVTPTPMEGTFATMSARSYSDEFFAAHSDRGVWTGDAWPAGAYKLDAVIFEGIDPSLSMQDAIHYTYATYSNEQELVSVEEKTYDRHLGYIATVQGGPQGGETLRVVYFAIGPDALLSLVFYPEAAQDEPDLQAMLGSFASALDEPVAFPAQAPSGPPDGSAIACQ